MNDWQAFGIVAMMAVVFFVSGAIGYNAGKDAVTKTKDSQEHWQLELELADVKARLATLERIGVEVNLNDRTGTWFVLNGKVQ